jgi:hypothetical protein
LFGALLGWGAIAASDATFPADSPVGLSQQARLLAELDGPDGLAVLTEVRRSAETGSGAVLTTEQSARPEQGLPDAGSARSAPDPRLLGAAQSDAAVSAEAFVTAPLGQISPAPAFAAIAGTVVQHPPSALVAPAPRQTTGAPAVNRSQVLSNLGRTELSFEPNVGQTASPVNYLARTGSGTVFLTPTAAVFAIQKSEVTGQKSAASLPSPTPEAPSRSPGVALYMDLVGANPAARPVGLQELPGKVNYFIGNDPAKWHTDIPTFGTVVYPNVYAGVSLAYYGGAGGLEYDFVLSPGADAHAIALHFRGADAVALDAQGDLVVHTSAGDLVQHAPVLYQDVGGVRQPVAGRFLLDSGLVRFNVGAYDPSRPLVVDPLVLGYSTYLGGSGKDLGYGIAADGKGAAYVVGQTLSTNFPTTPGAFDTSYNGGVNYGDVFVAKLATDGHALVYGTFLGGIWDDIGFGIAVDGFGSAYVTGSANFTGFPATITFGSAYGGAFITKLNPTGSGLVYSALIGNAVGQGIALDAAGQAMITGRAGPDFPVTSGAVQTQFGGNGGTGGDFGDAFAAKLNTSGTDLVYATYLGGVKDDDAYGIASDAAGHAFITGTARSGNFPTTPGSFEPVWPGSPTTAFLVKLSADGTALDYGTFLGSWDEAYAVAVDAAGNAYDYVFGNTGLPITATFGSGASWGAVIAKVNPAGSGLAYCVLLARVGRSGGIAVDAAGSAYLTGNIDGAYLLTTPDGFDTTYNGGGPMYHADATLSELSPDGNTLVYGTYLGGSNDDYGDAVAVDGGGNVYVAGYTQSANFPTTPDALKRRNRDGQYDGFVTKFALA